MSSLRGEKSTWNCCKGCMHTSYHPLRRHVCCRRRLSTWRWVRWVKSCGRGGREWEEARGGALLRGDGGGSRGDGADRISLGRRQQQRTLACIRNDSCHLGLDSDRTPAGGRPANHSPSPQLPLARPPFSPPYPPPSSARAFVIIRFPRTNRCMVSTGGSGAVWGT